MMIIPVLLAFAAFFFVCGIISDTRLSKKKKQKPKTKAQKQTLNNGCIVEFDTFTQYKI